MQRNFLWKQPLHGEDPILLGLVNKTYVGVDSVERSTSPDCVVVMFELFANTDIRHECPRASSSNRSCVNFSSSSYVQSSTPNSFRCSPV